MLDAGSSADVKSTSPSAAMHFTQAVLVNRELSAVKRLGPKIIDYADRNVLQDLKLINDLKVLLWVNFQINLFFFNWLAVMFLISCGLLWSVLPTYGLPLLFACAFLPLLFITGLKKRLKTISVTFYSMIISMGSLEFVSSSLIHASSWNMPREEV